jgi:ABC-2 type transport system permease protein
VNRRGVTAVVRRDLSVAMGSKAVVLPAVIVPLVLLVLLPGLAGVAANYIAAETIGDLEVLLEALPASAVAGMSSDPGLLAAELTVVYLLAPMVLLVPVMFAAVIAADGMAGETERGTLEGLLLTPLSDRELVTAKLLAAWVPATVVGLTGGALYAVVANLAVGVQVGRMVLPTVEFAVMVLWAGPAFAAASLAAVSLVSVRVKTTQEAFQLGGVVVLPVIALLVSQATGVLLLSVWLLVAAGVVALAVTAALLGFGARSLSRTRMGERLG